MKGIFLALSIFVLACNTISAQASYEFQQVSVIESVVPGGLGRSRMISTQSDGSMEETKLENYFSLAGINFGNVRSNDRAITDKITALSAQGWELMHVNSGVYGADTSTGIFITRYLFRRAL